MNRREFTATAGVAALASNAVGDTMSKPGGRSIIELRYMRLRNAGDNPMQRTSDFLSKSAVPALERAGIGPLGFFASVIGEETPFILALATFPSLAAMEVARDKEARDPEYIKGRDAYNAVPGLGYVRLESSLIRCFEATPHPEVLPVDPKRPARIFELRIYESNNGSTLSRKIKMFSEGEAAIFRRLGMRPVFFGETIVGRNMPNLVYMLSYDSLTDREAMWKAFGSDPEWKELRAKPGYADAEIVSNISNSILRPLPFSQIR